MSFMPAKREAVPVVVSIAGKSGSGKTYSSLLVAKGLAKGGKVGVIDTEARRSRIYAEDEAAGGFAVLDLYPPFTPDAYAAAIGEAEKAGIQVLVIDSFTHEWSGIGGCIEWADKIASKMSKPGPTAWIRPKMNHRRLVNRILGSPMHIVVCLRAGHKLVPVEGEDGKQKFAETAELVPETEKNFVYEMTMSAVLDDQHAARWVKLPKPLIGQLRDGQPLDISVGAAIREWVDGGAPVDRDLEQQLSIARDVASLGTDRLKQHMAAEAMGQWKERLAPWKRELWAIGKQADEMNAAVEPEPEPHPDEQFEAL